MQTFEPKQFGKYYLLEKLAVGGMAEIYKAKTFGVDGFEKLLVLKRILPHCSADKDFITMLTDEAKLSVTLSHANVVQVYDLGKVGDDYFISMEYISGVNLRDIIYRCREKSMKIPDELAAFIISEVCKGLDYAHRKTNSAGQPLNIVHRDVSPQNILLSYEGEVKIVDFGIAKAAMNISHTMAGILKGKIAYMSPEQALGKTVDYRADLFSTGIVLYEALTSEKLFTGESQFEVLKKIRTSRLDMGKLPDTIETELKQILVKALAYLPKDRYQSAGDMQIDLTRHIYTTHVDFTPQKLAGFIKELFSGEISKERERGALEQALEAQTSSINIVQEALQENLVHREETSPTMRAVDTTGPSSVSKKEHIEVTDSHKVGIGKRALSAAIVIVLLTGISFAYFKFIHPKITGPAGKAVPIGLTGIANISTNPAGAKIFLDGRDTDLVSPAILESLTIGKTYKLKFSKEGFADTEKPLTITSIDPVSVTAELNLEAGTLEIKTEPDGAEVRINGEPSGDVTPATLTGLPLNTDLEITLIKPSFKDFQQSVKLTSPKPQTLIAKLAPSEEFGAINISSEPAGAEIFLNGRDSGLVTPATIQNVPLGESQSVRLTKSGFQDVSKTVTLKEVAPMEISATLPATAVQTPPPVEVAPPPPVQKKKTNVVPTVKPAKEAVVPKEPVVPTLRSGSEKAPEFGANAEPATIKISSNPSGADVFINAEHRGTTPVTISNLKPGTVSVLVNKEGKARFSQKISLKPGETKDLGTVKLGEFYGNVFVSSTPSNAKVFVDGNDIGAKTPVTVRKVARDKSHTLKLVLDGYKTWEKTFDMHDSDDKKFNVNLEE